MAPHPDHGALRGSGVKLRAAIIIATSLVALNGLAAATAAAVTVICRQTSPQSAYAARWLGNALSERGLSGDRHQVILDIDPAGLQAEEFAIRPRGQVIRVIGGDNRGLIYGALSLAEMQRHGARLEDDYETHGKAIIKMREN